MIEPLNETTAPPRTAVDEQMQELLRFIVSELAAIKRKVNELIEVVNGNEAERT